MKSKLAQRQASLLAQIVLEHFQYAHAESLQNVTTWASETCAQLCQEMAAQAFSDDIWLEAKHAYINLCGHSDYRLQAWAYFNEVVKRMHPQANEARYIKESLDGI